MKIIKLILLLSLFMSAFLSKTVLALAVPFGNIQLNPNQTIQATYAFGSDPIIFCYENNLQSVGIVHWPFNAVQQTSTLSVSLKTNANFEGFFADPTGTITITNNQTIPLIVNCVFGF